MSKKDWLMVTSYEEVIYCNKYPCLWLKVQT